MTFFVWTLTPETSSPCLSARGAAKEARGELPEDTGARREAEWCDRSRLLPPFCVQEKSGGPFPVSSLSLHNLARARASRSTTEYLYRCIICPLACPGLTQTLKDIVDERVREAKAAPPGKKASETPESPAVQRLRATPCDPRRECSAVPLTLPCPCSPLVSPRCPPIVRTQSRSFRFRRCEGTRPALSAQLADLLDACPFRTHTSKLLVGGPEHTGFAGQLLICCPTLAWSVRFPRRPFSSESHRMSTRWSAAMSRRRVLPPPQPSAPCSPGKPPLSHRSCCRVLRHSPLPPSLLRAVRAGEELV